MCNVAQHGRINQGTLARVFTESVLMLKKVKGETDQKLLKCPWGSFSLIPVQSCFVFF